MTDLLNRALLWLLVRLARLPLPWLRRVGDALGMLVWCLAVPRRRITLRNLALCFPQWSAAQRRAVARAHFRLFLRGFLDRFILWYQPEERIRAFVAVEGLEHLDAVGSAPVILLAPHFVGIDAGGTRLTLDRAMATMFARQKNALLDAVMTQGRSRFNGAQLISRQDGVRPAVRALRQGRLLYFLPDMDLGVRDAVFVPFFGVPAATVTSTARLADMTQATILPCVTEMTPTGYRVRIYPPWPSTPPGDAAAAAQAMNAFIEARVLEMPAQYLWSHRRFKSRPPGEPSLYR